MFKKFSSQTRKKIHPFLPMTELRRDFPAIVHFASERCRNGVSRRLIEFLTLTFHSNGVNEDKGRGFLIITFHETRCSHPEGTFCHRGCRKGRWTLENEASRNSAFMNSRSRNEGKARTVHGNAPESASLKASFLPRGGSMTGAV